MTETTLLEKLSRCKISLRQKNPYFAVLTLFANYKFDNSIELVETDGISIKINPESFSNLSDSVATGLLLHVTLHAALLHPIRQSLRNPELWNIACDIMVNHIIKTQTDLPIPPGTATANEVSIKLIPLSAEQVYEFLLQQRKTPQEMMKSMKLQGNSFNQIDGSGNQHDKNMQPDQIRKSGLAAAMANKFGKKSDSNLSEGTAKEVNDTTSSGSGASKLLRDICPSSSNQLNSEAIRQHWETALQKGQEQEKLRNQGTNKSSWYKELEAACSPQIDWRNLLSRFVIRTPNDYSGIDRRFIHSGLYLEMLENETVLLDLAIDTSGSIQPTELNMFVSELLGILNMYPSINCQVYFCDNNIDGPHVVSQSTALPPARGGGGTDFRPFFELINKSVSERELGVVIYFTDGKGIFPETTPQYPVLWVVVPGGEDTEKFPFGQVIRLA
ncbi:MAG: hypothetical protein IPK77_00035 [Cellvibrio sp.]|nr:hypothetical protein [Cellvibrio sp.]